MNGYAIDDGTILSGTDTPDVGYYSSYGNKDLPPPTKAASQHRPHELEDPSFKPGWCECPHEPMCEVEEGAERLDGVSPHP